MLLGKWTGDRRGRASAG